VNRGAGVDLTHDGRSGTERLVVGVRSQHQARRSGRLVRHIRADPEQRAAHQHLQHRVEWFERVLNERMRRPAEHGARHYRAALGVPEVFRMSRPKRK